MDINRTRKVNRMKTNLKKASQDLRNWLNKTEKATGLPKPVLITGILMNFALNSNEQDEMALPRKDKHPKTKNPLEESKGK